MTFRGFAQRGRRFVPLLALPAALLFSQGQAKAVLIYNIYESSGDVIVQASGSLNLPSAVGAGDCDGADGGIASYIAIICTGPNAILNVYGITGPATFDGSVFNGDGSSTSSISTYISGNSGLFVTPGFGISSGYTSGDPIFSSSIFTGQTLASLGFTLSSGLIGTWSLDGTSDTIQAFLGPPSAEVPGPLPLFGAAAAFGWSRRMRRRISAPLITPPQA